MTYLRLPRFDGMPLLWYDNGDQTGWGQIPAPVYSMPTTPTSDIYYYHEDSNGTLSIQLSSLITNASFVNDTISRGFRPFFSEPGQNSISHRSCTLGAEYSIQQWGIIAERHLADSGNSFMVKKGKYHLVTDKTSSRPILWTEWFIPDPDPELPGPQEPVVMAVRSWAPETSTVSPNYPNDDPATTAIDPTNPATVGFGMNGTYTVSLLPVEIKETSHGFPPTSLPAKYNKAPRNGSVDNVISVWPAEELTLTVELPEPFKSNPPAGLITWTVPGHTVPDRTSEFKMSWTDTGFKTVLIKVGETTFKVVIDLPNVGNTSQGSALLAVDPITAASIVLYGTEARDYSNANYGVTPQRDAMRHSFWTALCASDILVDMQGVLFVTTGHEHNNKWGFDNAGNPAPPQQAFNSTMDLRNNLIGSTTAHTTWSGVPDRPAILNDLRGQYSRGLMWIYDGNGSEAQSEGIITKSDRKKIFPN